MTLLLPAADRVVREAVEAMLDGRSRPGAGADISFATRSSRYRVIHGVLREATDTSLVGARFVGWLFDATSDTRISERWDPDARAVLIDEVKGQIVVTSITRVHVSNALPPGDILDLPPTQVEYASKDGFIPRASTLHGMPVVDPETEAPHRPATPRPAAGAPAAASGPSAPQHGSQIPKKLTIPPAPPIPGRQNTPIPQNRLPTPPHGGARTQPMAVMTPPPPPITPQPPPGPPPAGASPAPPHGRSGTAQGLGLSPVTEDVEIEVQRKAPEPAPRMNPRTMLGLMAATRPPPPPPPTEPTAVAPPKDGPLPQFDLDDLDDMPTRHDPTPWGAPPPAPTISQTSSGAPDGTDALEEVSAEIEVEGSDDGETVIPLVSRPQS